MAEEQRYRLVAPSGAIPPGRTSPPDDVILVGGDHFPLFRFFVPVLGLCAIVASRVSRALAAQSRIPLAVAVAIVLAGNSILLLTPDMQLASREAREAAAWARTGRWCAEHLEPGLVATLVVGAIPFYCNSPTLDLLGLVDTHIARSSEVFEHAAVGHQKHDTEYVLSRRPRYIFFTSSGQVTAPLFRTVDSRRRLSTRTTQALGELVTHPKTLADYEYRAEPLSDGTWVEFLELRRSAAR
jgi:hypothetical protein